MATHHRLQKKPRHHCPIRVVKNFNVPASEHVSFANDSYLNYTGNICSNNKLLIHNADLTWVNTLSHTLFELLINFPNLTSQAVSPL